MPVYWDELAAKVRNWGRWGANDEIGTLNLITPAKVLEAVATVREGRVIPLGVPFDANGPSSGAVGRFNPVHYMRQDYGDGADQEARGYGAYRYADDHIVMPLQCASQWDALSHVYYEDHLYNGHHASNVTSTGARKNSVAPMARNGIVSRGVLLDIARLRGVAWMNGGDAITADDFEKAESAQGVTVTEGDILLVRTGWWAMFLQRHDAQAFWNGEPGLDHTTIEWLHSRGVAAVACDNYGIERAGERGTDPPNDRSRPFHPIAIRDMGMPLGEIWNLEELSAACAAASRWSFLLVAPPLEFTGAVGSPVNPVAIL